MGASIAQAIPTLIDKTVDYDHVIVQADGTEVEAWSQSAIVADDRSSPEFSEGAVTFFVFDIGPSSIHFETGTDQCCDALGDLGGFNSDPLLSHYFVFSDLDFGVGLGIIGFELTFDRLIKIRDRRNMNHKKLLRKESHDY